MEQLALRSDWLHAYLLVALETDFPVSEAIFHVMTWGSDFEGKGHRQPLDLICEAGPVISWHGYQKCNDPTHYWHVSGKNGPLLAKHVPFSKWMDLFTIQYAE